MIPIESNCDSKIHVQPFRDANSTKEYTFLLRLTCFSTLVRPGLDNTEGTMETHVTSRLSAHLMASPIVVESKETSDAEVLTCSKRLEL